MRLDIRNMDRKYCAQFDVTLNGVKQTQCIVADSDKGYVIRYKTSKFGLHEMKNGKTVHERVEGLVTIVNREKPQLKSEMTEDKLLPHQKEVVAHIEKKESQFRNDVRMDLNRRGKSILQTAMVATLLAQGEKGLTLNPLSEMKQLEEPKPDLIFFDETSRLVKKEQ